MMRIPRLHAVSLLFLLGFPVAAFGEDPAAKPAVVEIADWRSLELREGGTEGFRMVPEYLRNAKIHAGIVDAKVPADRKNQLTCTVLESGVLVMAATWSEPRRSGGVRDPKLSRPEALVENGWIAIDTMQQRSEETTTGYTIFRRVVRKGEKYEFRTDREHPPLAIVLKPEQVPAVLAKSEIVAPTNPIAALDPPTNEVRGMPATSRDVLLLSVQDHPEMDSTRLWNDMLIREIVRQAILMAAREELGISTRDAILREEFPQTPNPSHGPLGVMVAIPWNDGRIGVTIYHQVGDKYVPVWNEEWTGPKKRISVALTSRMTRYVHSKFPRLLRSLDYEGAAKAFRRQGAVPDEIENQLSEFSVLNQYSAVRKLHGLAHRDGSSPEILSALARAYANLGVLTEHLWSPAHVAFKARALLYAERCLSRSSEEMYAHARFTRGYVRALIGMHSLAETDFADGNKRLAESDASAKLPDWADVAWNFVKYDSDRLQKAEDEGSQQALARLLRVLAVEGNASEQESTSVEAASRMLQVAPDCDRATNLFHNTMSLGVRRAGAFQAAAYFANSLYPAIRRFEDLPDSVREVSAKREATDDESKLRADLIRTLKSNGSVENDHHEPSLDCLGQLVQEISFSHAIHMLTFQKYLLGVDPAGVLGEMDPLLEGHPYEFYARGFAHDPKSSHDYLMQQKAALDSPQARAQLQDIDYSMLLSIYYADQDLDFWNETTLVRHRHGVRDLFYDRLRALIESKGVYIKYNLRELKKISPHMPATIAAEITHAWPSVRGRSAKIEKKYRDEPVIMLRLGRQFAKQEKLEDAERCYRRLIEIQPEWAGYHRLASLQWKRKDYEAWKNTLEEFLEVPVAGLQHAQARVKIANYYMDVKQPEKALPYAEAAAGSYAAWALLCAAQSHEDLGNWKEAEQFVRATAERYDDSALDWLQWCVRTGRGDEAAARAHARRHLESLGELPANRLYDTANYYQLIEESESAVEILSLAVGKTGQTYETLRLAVLADELGKTELRDAMLRKVAESQPKKNFRIYVTLAEIFRKYLADTNKGKIDKAVIEEVVETGKSQQPTYVWQLVGHFLANRGDKDGANHYLRLAAGSPHRALLPTALASRSLRKQEIEIPERRRFEIPDTGADPVEP